MALGGGFITGLAPNWSLAAAEPKVNLISRVKLSFSFFPFLCSLVLKCNIIVMTQIW